MHQRKIILVVSREEYILDAICAKFVDHPTFHVEARQSELPLEKLVPALPSIYPEKVPDLIVFVRYSVSHLREMYESVEQVQKVYPSIKRRVLFVEHEASPFFKSYEEPFELFPFQDLFVGPSLENAFDRLLGTFTHDYSKRVRIADRSHPEAVPPPPPIPPEARIILDRLRASHMFALDCEFPNWHVLYSRETTCDFEEEYDRRAFDPEDRFVETIDEFHQAFIENDRRVTYLLIGHRGCGKSSFLRHYFQQHEPFRRLNQPYVIVDFLNYYGLVEDSGDLQFAIITALHNHFRGTNTATLIRKYPTIQSLFPPDAVRIVLNHYGGAKVPFNEVISERLQYDIEGVLGRLEKAHIGRILLDHPEATDSEAISEYQHHREMSEWTWLIGVWQYMSLHSKEKPVRFFANWILEKSFEEKAGITCASVDLFGSKMKAWRDARLKDGLAPIATYNIAQIEELVTSFLMTATGLFGKVHIALDNADQIAAPLAEYQMMRSIYEHIARAYPFLKVVVSVRPGTYYTQKQPLQDIIPEDTTAYHKYWLHNVSLGRVLDKRLQELTRIYKEPKESAFLALLGKFVRLPVLQDKTLRSSDARGSITHLISGVTGNNVRDGVEIFADLVKSWYPYLHQYGGSGLFRRNIYNEEYVAEHIAVRATFLEREGEYEFKDSLVNLFHVPGLSCHRSTLAQIRALEILNKLKKVPIKHLFELLGGLGYTGKDVQVALGQLQRTRLLALLPRNTPLHTLSDDALVLSRYRGDYYCKHLLGSLSYIQMVYFMTPLPSCFADILSYPNIPEVGQLKKVVDNFLHALWVDIAYERTIATSAGIEAYEREITKLASVHQAVCSTYEDLKYIVGD